MKILAASIFLSLPAAIHGAVGGRCSSFWGETGCICLDKSVCENRWGGVAIQGWAPDWPCPNDPDNVWGCQIHPCPGQGGGTSCEWREQCIIPVAGERKLHLDQMAEPYVPDR